MASNGWAFEDVVFALGAAFWGELGLGGRV